jgi:hypothetical protein
MTLARLKRRARQDAKRHGHVLSSFQRDAKHHTQYALCRHIHCAAGVVIDPHPLSKQLAVAGEAIESDCRGGPRA